MKKIIFMPLLLKLCELVSSFFGQEGGENFDFFLPQYLCPQSPL